MRRQLRYLFLLFILLTSRYSGAQTISARMDSIGQRITGSLTEYSKKYPQEKIFIHSDQNVYLNGQTIWYKAYLLAYGSPSTLSKIVYVRLSDSKGRIIKEDKLPVKNSTAFGDINLPDSLATGWYQLDAFTAWMLNFDRKDLYHQSIYIRNVHDQIAAITPFAAKTYHVDLFPEGGQLVDGYLCNIAFKATDEHGMPVKVYGEVLDNNKKPVANLITRHDGMGTFELEAQTGSHYIARIHLPDSSVQNVAMPKVQTAGISMRVDIAPVGELQMKISYTDPLLDHKDIVIEAVQNNGVIAGYPVRLRHGINLLRLKKADFATGILRLTIFDQYGIPGAERIVFINNIDQFRLSLVKDTLSFDPKSTNVFTVNLKPINGQSANANLSVSVTDAAVGNAPGESISSYFLMSSELRGYINRPGYYFKNNSDSLQQQLDLVMLTNGWRHFKWDSVLKMRPKPLKYFVESSQMIAGQIENYHDKDNLKIKMMITSADSSKKAVLVSPDSTGCFALKDYDRQGNANVYFEVVNAKNRRQPVKIIFLKQDFDTMRFVADTLNGFTEALPFIKRPFVDSIAIQQDRRFITSGILLKTVRIKERKLTATDLLVKTHVHRLELDDGATTLDLVNTPSLPGGNILNYIQGRFPGLLISYTPLAGYTFSYHGNSNVDKGDTPDSGKPFFYVDEARSTLHDIEEIPLQDVALIRFAPPPAWFAPGGGGFNGAILVYTKIYGDVAGINSRRSFDTYNFNGYSVTREFPLPDYAESKPKQLTDYRTTLYWNHDVSMDANGNFKVRFYNSDKGKKYRVVIQGMDVAGRLGYLSEEF